MESIGAPPSPRGSIFTPLLISMVGILATSLAIVAYHLLIVKYCLRRQADPAGQLLSAPRAPLSTGVDAEILETIPILSYSKCKGSIFHVDQSECAVCLAELQDADMVRLLPSCRHVFHIICIDAWFVAHASCPVCRSPVTAPVPLPGDTQDGDGLHRPSSDQFQRGISNGSDLGKQLRHCGSCVLPMDERPRPAMEGLKRSLSMGQSYVIIDTHTESERGACSSSSPKPILGLSGWYKARSVRQIDRASSSLRRSFSRLRMGLSGRSNQILPY